MTIAIKIKQLASRPSDHIHPCIPTLQFSRRQTQSIPRSGGEVRHKEQDHCQSKPPFQ